MSTQVYITANTLSAYTARREVMGGRSYLVAPVTMLVEGIHHGSAGPVFYPSSELQAFPASWDGRPVTLGHPELEGQPVSASNLDAIELFSLGTLYNTRYDAELRGLRSEVWLDVDRARRLAPEVLSAMLAGEPIEVSTGLWFEPHGGEGMWGNEEFETTATGFRPDHLALLPDAVGACSISDGCGLRANKKKGGKEVSDATGEKGALERFFDFMRNEKPSKEQQVAVLMAQFAANQPGMLSVIRALQSELDKLDRDVPNGMLMHWLEEAFDDGTFVLRQEGPEGRKFFKGSFTMTENEGVEISEGDFTEVRKTEEFIDVSNNGEPQEVINEEEDIVSDSRKALVDNLIACTKCPYTENHRAGLMAMDDSALEALKVNDTQQAAPAPAPAVAPAAENVQPKTLEEAVAGLPTEHQSVINEAIKVNETRKAEAVKNILAAPGNTYTEEVLTTKNLADVLAIEAIVKGNKEEGGDDTKPKGNEEKPEGAPAGNYSGAAPVATNQPATNEGDDDAPLGRPV